MMPSFKWILVIFFLIEVKLVTSIDQSLNEQLTTTSPAKQVYIITPSSASSLLSTSSQSPSITVVAETDSGGGTSSNVDDVINWNATSPTPIKTSSANQTRTIQRLVGGHLHHQQTSSPSLRNSNQKSRNVSLNTTAENISKVYFRRKTTPSNQSNDQRNISRGTTQYRRRLITTTTLSPVTNNRQSNRLYSDFFDDTALLEEDNSNGIDNWDSGLLRASAGAGQESTTIASATAIKKKDDSKKTLADQVAEGKYGLIQKELFENKPVRPGVVSYLTNSEVPKDNNKNYGGLEEDDIWLAEDHLLVLKGGNLNKNDDNEWKPIDNYQAPLRQVKIPNNPKIPPPFPVQLEDNGPIQFIGNHQIPVFNPFTNESLPLFPGIGSYPGDSFNNDKTNLFTGSGPFGNATKTGSGGYQYPPPIHPWFFGNNETFSNPFVNPPPFFGPTPPPFPFPPFSSNGSLENSNITDYFDEDDPSLYYPSPYTFYYKTNYSSLVPPGPLVPGIVLPPPPNFFGRLDEKKRLELQQRLKTTPRPVSTPSRTTVTKLNKQIVKPAITKLTSTVSYPTIKSTTTTTTTTTTTQSPPLYKDNRQKYYISRYKEKDNTVFNYQTTPIVVTTTITTTCRPVTTVKKVVNLTPNVIQYIPNVNQASEGGAINQDMGHPIYYEYFDARKKVPNDQQLQYLPPITTTTTTTPRTTTYRPTPPSTTSIPVNYYNHNKPTVARPVYPSSYKQPGYLPVVNTLPKQPESSYIPIVDKFDYDRYLYITPQPEIKPNGISTNFVPLEAEEEDNSPALAVKPLKTHQNFNSPTFNHEIETIRATLKYFQTQPQTGVPEQATQLPRTPKAKAVYEYSFDATDRSTAKPQFTPPVNLDSTPFKPMVQYSPSLDSDGGFKPFSTNTEAPPIQYYSTTPALQTRTPIQYYDNKFSLPHRSTQRLLPVLQTSTESSIPNYYTQKDTVLFDDITKKYFNVFGQKINNIEAVTNSLSPVEYTTLPAITSSTPQASWLDKQIYNNYNQPSKQQPALYPVQYQRPSNTAHRGYNSYSRNIRPFDGYHYDRPDTNRPIGNYYFNQRQQSDPYMRQIALLRYKLNQQKEREFVDLSNDTNVNYASPLPPINPDSESIGQEVIDLLNSTNVNRPYQSQYNSNNGNSEQFGQIVNQPNRYNSPPPPNYYQSSQRQPPISLHKDILVNYQYPRPPVNPDSEFIVRPYQPQQQYRQQQQYQVQRQQQQQLQQQQQQQPQQQQQQQYKKYQNPVIQYRLPGQQAHVFFITPQDIKYNKK